LNERLNGVHRPTMGGSKRPGDFRFSIFGLILAQIFDRFNKFIIRLSFQLERRIFHLSDLLISMQFKVDRSGWRTHVSWLDELPLVKALQVDPFINVNEDTTMD
jgi:hypothetical protein